MGALDDGDLLLAASVVHAEAIQELTDFRVEPLAVVQDTATVLQVAVSTVTAIPEGGGLRIVLPAPATYAIVLNCFFFVYVSPHQICFYLPLSLSFCPLLSLPLLSY